MGNNNINNAQNVNVNDDVTLGNPGPASGGSAASLQGQLGVDEPAGQGFPGGWGGGIHSWDIYANGTVGTGENGSLNAYMNDFNGGIGGGGQVVTTSPNGGNYAYMSSTNNGASVVTNGTVQGGYVNSTGNVNAQNALTVNGGSAGWINNQGNGAVAQTFTGNALGANWIWSNGSIQAGYQMQLGTAGGSANVGWGCSPNGAIAANANGSGQLLSCVNGTWQEPQSAPSYTQEATFLLPNINGGENVGYWRLCTISGRSNTGGGYVGVSTNGPENAYGQWDWIISESGSGYQWFTCFN